MNTTTVTRSITFNTRLAANYDSNTVGGRIAVWKKHGMGVNLFMADNGVQSLLNWLYSATTKLHNADVYGEQADEWKTGEVVALYVAAAVNLRNSEVDELLNTDVIGDDFKRELAKIDRRLRNVERAVFGKTVHIEDCI